MVSDQGLELPLLSSLATYVTFGAVTGGTFFFNPLRSLPPFFVLVCFPFTPTGEPNLFLPPRFDVTAA